MKRAVGKAIHHAVYIIQSSVGKGRLLWSSTFENGVAGQSDSLCRYCASLGLPVVPSRLHGCELEITRL